MTTCTEDVTEPNDNFTIKCVDANSQLSGSALKNSSFKRKMSSLSITIEIGIDVPYFEKNTKLLDDEIADLVYEHVGHERNALVTEAKHFIINILNGKHPNDKS